MRIGTQHRRPPDLSLHSPDRLVNRISSVVRFVPYAWAAPCSLVGLLLGIIMLLRGGKATVHFGIVEFALLRHAGKPCGRFGAITFGHVVLGRDENVLNCLRAHELEHVKQYERWGALFFVAYPASSLFQLMCGRDPHWHNHFEVQARERCMPD